MRLRILTELALVVALAVVFDLLSKSLPIPRLYQGGSVSIHMLPIFVLAFRHGWKVGMTAGAAYGLLNLIVAPYIIHPVQVPLDYLVAFSLVGIAGLGTVRGATQHHPSLSHRVRLTSWVLIGNGLRFLAHFVSGIVFWSQNAPDGQAVWIYSLLYNAAYMGPETLIDIVLLQLMLRRIFHYLR